MILACGVLNGEITNDCRTFGADRNVASEEQCLNQVMIGNAVMEANNWRMVDWYCFNWNDVNRNLGEPA